MLPDAEQTVSLFLELIQPQKPAKSKGELLLYRVAHKPPVRVC